MDNCAWGVKVCNFFRGKDAIINDMTDLYYVEDAYRLYNELDESQGFSDFIVARSEVDRHDPQSNPN